jgi:hypothetical protein
MRRARSWARSGGSARPGGAACALAWCGLGVVVLGAGAPAGPAGGSTTSTAPLEKVVIPNPGAGYTVISQGPHNPVPFAADAPDPSAAAGALATLASTISTYERVWQADGTANQVQDLLIRFEGAAGAQMFLRAAQHSLESGEIVSSDTVSSIPGARRVTYFAATDQDGVGEAVTMRAGEYVDLLSFFSAAWSRARPISPADAERVARAQYAAMVQVPGGTNRGGPAARSTKSVSAGTVVVAVLVVAVLALAVATPALLRRRRLRVEGSEAGTAVPSSPLGPSSGGATVDDLRQHGG